MSILKMQKAEINEFVPKSDYVVEIPYGAIMCKFDNGTFAYFVNARSNKCVVGVACVNRKLVKIIVRGECARQISEFYAKTHKKCKIKVSKMMGHDRYVKHSGGGQSIHNNVITDYECCKTPLNDFARVRI